MNILILGHNYAPEMTGIGPYNTELAEHLVKRGHEVTALTTFPHYPRYRWATRPGVAKRENINGVAVRRLRAVLPRRATAFWRVLFDTSVGLGYLPNSVGVRRPDVVIATVPTLQGAYVACWLARMWRAQALLMVQDLPVEAGIAVGMLKGRVPIRVGRAIERGVFRMANHAVVIAELLRDNLVANGVQSERVTVIPDWVDLDAIAPRASEPAVRRHLSGSENGFLILHTGAIGEKQGLGTVVDTAKLLASDPDIHTVLVGDGPARLGIERQIAAGRLASMRVMDIQPRDYFSRMLSAADALLLNQRADVIDAVAPSKLLSYMAAGRPIIAAVNSDSVAGRVVADAQCGLVVSPEDPEQLASAIKQLRGDAQLRTNMGQAGRAYAEREFGREGALARWSDLIDTLGSGVLSQTR